MEMPALIALMVDAILVQCPQYDRATITGALESVFAGNPTVLGGNTISMLLGQQNNFTNATITIGDVHAGHTISVQLPQPIDPLPAALAALASLPLDHVPLPRADLPQTSRLPFEASLHFVGREAELKALAQAIGMAQPAVVMPAIATGLGGIGKTSLVTEFAYRYGRYFHGGVFWLNCAEPAQIASQIAACAVALKIDTTGLSLDEQVQRVIIAWQSPIPRLLIFDNCDDPTILQQWKPTIGGCRVLVTARSDHWPTLTQIRLGLLTPEESRALLQRLCARLTDADAEAIADDLGHLPLALHLAGSYLNTYDHHTIDQYRKDLTIAHRSLKGRGALPSPTRHEQDVEATFMLSFNQLDPKQPIDALALDMLDGAAWCAPGVPIPRDLVLALVPAETDADDQVDALRRLQQLGLLDGAEAVVLHRLLAQVIQTCLGSTETLALVEEKLIKGAERINTTGMPNQMLPLEPHLRHVTMRAFHREDVQAVRLANSLGFFETSRGMYQTAQPLYERALKIFEQQVGASHPVTVGLLNHLALVMAHQGCYENAQELYERAIVIAEQVFGADHPHTNGIRTNLAGVLYRQGHYQLAQALLDDCRMSESTDAAAMAGHLNQRALVLEQQGHYKEAQHYYEQALAIASTVLGEDHPITAKYRSNVAVVLGRQGYNADAAGIYDELGRDLETRLGTDHPEVALNLNNRALAQISQGNYTEAQSMMERAVAICERVWGATHQATAMSMNHLSLALIYQERYAEAQPILEQAIGIYERVLGPMHPEIAAAVSNLAGVLAHQGQYREAQILFERALAVREATLGMDHPDTKRIRANIMGLSQHLP